MRQRCLLLGILLLCLSLLSFGQQVAISARFAKPQAAVLPGKVVNLAFRVENHSSDTIELSPDFSYPEDWNIISKPETITLAPQSTEIGIVSLKSPHNARVGSYLFQARFQSVSIQLAINVLEVEKITLQLLENPKHVLAGENIEATYLVKNLGNTEKKVFLSTSNCDVIGSPDLKIQPGESVHIQVKKETNAEIFESKEESYILRAETDHEVRESVFASTIVMPSKKAKRDLYFRFPIEFSSTYLGTNQNDYYESGHQFQIEGHGSLDTEGKHELGFLARWPNNSDLSFAGMYDEYYVYYKQRNINLFLGEKSYSLTPLTENARFSSGAEAKIILNNGLEFGAMYMEPQFYDTIDNEMAAYSTFRFNKKNELSLHYLKKKYSNINDPAHLFSFSTALEPFPKTAIELEYSQGKYNGNSSGAGRAELQSSFSIFQLSGLYYKAGKNYPGYYSNTKFYSGSLNMRLSKQLSLALTTREDFTNAELDTLFVIAPYYQLLQASLSYRFGKASSLMAYWRDYERKDRSTNESYHYGTKSWNLQFSQRLNRFYYLLSGEFGTTTNYLLDTDDNQQNSYSASASLNYRFNSNHSVRIFGDWSNTNQFVSDDQQSVFAGISASSNINKNLKMNFYLQNAYDIDDSYQNRNLMQLQLTYSFLKRHSISLQSYYTLFKNETDDADLSLAATYKYSLGIPLKQVISSGAVRGRILNPNGEPVKGVYLQLLNETAVSDKLGEFDFKSVPPGRHMLVVDRTKMNIDELTNIPIPMELEVLENEATNINIQIQKGAHLSGKIELKNTNLAALANEQPQPGNIVVELKTTWESYRISTDSEGRFDFPLLRPGDVTLKIFPSTIPTGFAAPQSNYTYHLQPAEQREVKIVLKSRKKNIIFKPSGTSLSVKNGIKPLKITTNETETGEKEASTVFYTIQIGAFRKHLSKNSRFLAGHPFYFEKQIDNLHKYFLGKYKSYDTAKAELEKIRKQYKDAFIVVLIDDKIVSLHEFRNMNIKQ